MQSFAPDEGTRFRYDTAPNEFGIINEHGGISTYFKPESGITHWLGQIEKHPPKEFLRRAFYEKMSVLWLLNH